MFNIRSLGSERSCELELTRIMFGSEICCPRCQYQLSKGQGYWWCGRRANRSGGARVVSLGLCGKV